MYSTTSISHGGLDVTLVLFDVHHVDACPVAQAPRDDDRTYVFQSSHHHDDFHIHSIELFFAASHHHQYNLYMAYMYSIPPEVFYLLHFLEYSIWRVMSTRAKSMSSLPLLLMRKYILGPIAAYVASSDEVLVLVRPHEKFPTFVDATIVSLMLPRTTLSSTGSSWNLCGLRSWNTSCSNLEVLRAVLLVISAAKTGKQPVLFIICRP